MERRANTISADEQRYESAGEWLQRLDNPDLTEEDLQSWLEWFGASDLNRKAFEELQGLRRRVREAPVEYRNAFRQKLGLAGAPAVTERRGLPRSVPARARSAASFGTDNPGLRKRFKQKWLIAAVVPMAAVILGYWQFGAPQQLQALYTAPPGEHRTVALSDGSSLVLGANAIVAMTFTKQQRLLNVERGEAYFEVQRNPQRPFVVLAGGVQVTALGTAFNVIRSAEKVTVTVTEGLVEIGQPMAKAGKHNSLVKTRRLSVGQRAVMAVDNTVPGVRASEASSVPVWQDGRIEFVNTPLAQVLQVINPHISGPLSIDDPRVADLTYSGTILRDHLDEWVASLPRIYSIRTVALEGGGMTLVMRTPSSRGE